MPRLRSLWLCLAEVSHRLEASEELDLASDFDGTLVPIREHPDHVSLSDRVRAVTQKLAVRPEVRLAVLSGRRLEDLEREFDGGRMFLAGSGGLESRDAQGRRQVHVPAETALPETLRTSLSDWCRRFPGAWAEDKRFSVALHYRAVAAELQPAFAAGVRRRVRPHRDAARLVHGKRVFEIMPAVPWEKSAALRLWLEGRTRPGMLFYFGDDTIDEPVHRLVRERGGISVAVGRVASEAEYSLPSPTEVVWFLEWLERQWAARDATVEELVERRAGA